MTARSSSATRFWEWIVRSTNALVGGVIVIAGLTFLLALSMGWIEILPYASKVGGDSDRRAAPGDAPTSVELTPEKLAAAGLHLTTVETRSIGRTRDVPA